MKFDEQTILTNFEKLFAAKSGALSDNDVDSFVKRNFEEDTLDTCDLRDFTNNPPVLAHIKDPVYREFARNVHNIWPQLTGQVNSAVKKNPERYSYIYIPHCFVKVSSSRLARCQYMKFIFLQNTHAFQASVNFFVESYYWDSHWVGEGLIESGMLQTYKGMLTNMFEIVKQFGQMLNGNRIYYIGRSQPPFLTMMAKKYEDASNDHQFIKKYLPVCTEQRIDLRCSL